MKWLYEIFVGRMSLDLKQTFGRKFRNAFSEGLIIVITVIVVTVVVFAIVVSPIVVVTISPFRPVGWPLEGDHLSVAFFAPSVLLTISVIRRFRLPMPWLISRSPVRGRICVGSHVVIFVIVGIRVVVIRIIVVRIVVIRIVVIRIVEKIQIIHHRGNKILIYFKI